MKLIANNKEAYHNYFVLDTFEAGICLIGSEVKSMRGGWCNLKDSFVTITHNNEMLVKNMFIKAYEKSSVFTPDERRERKLLMHKSEINKIKVKLREKGFTLVPLKCYFKDSRAKIELGLCKGKHTYDKKATLQEKDKRRELEREIKNYTR